jgi:ABC-type glycerol-3-phosphate transport system substrate-binding protein
MNRRMFLASMAGVAAASSMTSAASTVGSTYVTLPTFEPTTPLPEWDYTAEDFDAFLTRTTGAHGRGRLTRETAMPR